MTSRQRLAAVMGYRPADRVPWLEEGVRDNVLQRWLEQGMPQEGPGAVFKFDHRHRIEFDWSLRDQGRTGVVTRDELPRWRENLQRPLEERLGDDWDQRVQGWRQRDYLLELQAHSGLFLTLGVDRWSDLEELMYVLADDPQVAPEAMRLQGQLAQRIVQRVMDDVELDMVSISEPIGGNHGPLVGPEMYRRMALGSYGGLVAEARGGGVPAIVFMTYANVRCLLPDILRCGFNCLWAMETEGTAMDYGGLRREFGRELRLIGGIDLDSLLAGEEAIERELAEKVPPLLADGGFIPLADGRVRATVPWERYVFYRRLLEKTTGPRA